MAELTEVIFSQIAGVQIWPLRNKPDGTFDLDEMEEKVRDHTDDHEPRTSLICVENTQNWCGGKVVPLEWLDDVSTVQRDLNECLQLVTGKVYFHLSVYTNILHYRISLLQLSMKIVYLYCETHIKMQNTSQAKCPFL
jgi:hypothetical protein